MHCAYCKRQLYSGFLSKATTAIRPFREYSVQGSCQKKLAGDERRGIRLRGEEKGKPGLHYSGFSERAPGAVRHIPDNDEGIK
jgi:hypothetical protein